MAWKNKRRPPPGATTRGGWGADHQKLRARWKPVVDAGQATCRAVICVMPTRRIPPGTEWHLGHTADRTAWTGPEHAKCNLADGARRANQNKKRRSYQRKLRTVTPRLTTSRRWLALLTTVCTQCPAGLRTSLARLAKSLAPLRVTALLAGTQHSNTIAK